MDGVDHVVGTDLEGQRPLVGRRVDRDHPGRRHLPQQLEAHVAEPSDADGDDARSGDHPGQALLDRAVRRQARVGERRGLDRIEGAEGDEMAGRGHQEALGVAPRTADAAPEGHVAELLLTAEAVSAVPATPATEHGDGLADLDPGRSGTEGLDPAGVLVAECPGERRQTQRRHRPVPQVQVRMADAAAGDPNDHFARSGIGVGYLLDGEVLVVSVQPGSSHEDLRDHRGSHRAPIGSVGQGPKVTPEAARGTGRDQGPCPRPRSGRTLGAGQTGGVAVEGSGSSMRVGDRHDPAGSVAASTSGLVAWLSELGRDDVARAGGKGANLGELTRAGLPVPEGFVVLADAYLQSVEEAGIRDELRQLAVRPAGEDAATTGVAAARARGLVAES